MNLLVAGLVAVLAGATPEDARDFRPSGLLDRSGEARTAASAFLRHLYAVHLSLRGCTEAAARHGKPEFLPGVTLEEARAAMRVVDQAAREVGLDVDGIWREVAPMATVTAEALKADKPDNAANCARIGGVFRVDLANLQNALRALGSTRSLIEKDF